jgi:hypothetical protein
MRPAVPQRHQLALVVQDLSHAVDPPVERGHGELDLEVVLEGQVQEGIDAVLALLAGDVRDRAPLERFEGGRFDL